MDVILTDTAQSKCFRYLPKGRIDQLVRSGNWQETSDDLYRIRDTKGDGTKVTILFDYYEDEDKAVVITQKARYHENN